MTKKIETKSRRRTPWTGVSEATPMQIFIETCTRDDYEGKHPEIKGSAEIPLLNSMSVEECRQCGSGHIKKRGFTANGLQRYKCLDCGCSFNILTNTLFDCHKIPLTEWLDFLLDIFGYGSFSLTSKANRNSINTTKYWIEKVFLMLEDYQKDIVLGGKVWIDETFYRVREPDVQRRPDGKEYRIQGPFKKSAMHCHRHRWNQHLRRCGGYRKNKQQEDLGCLLLTHQGGIPSHT